ncbi:hypothetical protein [Nitrosopumilus maritimus]|uniref:Small ribosomal subunit protein eS17 n=1 Tax=Nitrosopumilus maritimus (strain SCM1) TaxID=436308 RepID=A9A3R4_NITMS|nr:hypothetical protein [Nitrosopumilus maritimus]ABX13326.1 hypothetical protein Nmar_1430 [Nitrosopumilus maritimus SCM1]
MDRIKRLSYEVLETHKSKFGEDFADNKKILNEVSIVRSKGLKNEIAGYITNYIKKEIREEKAKKAQAEASKSLEQEAQVEPEPVEATENTEAPAAEETPETEAPAVEATENTEAPAAETTPETPEEKSE